MAKTFNWGIVATGKIAHHFAKDLALVPNAQLFAVASRRLEKAQEFAQEYGAEYACGSYEELFELPDLDAVYIATPHTFHNENTLSALARQVAVLCEKPFAMNLAQVREMVIASKAYDTFLMEALWSRFNPTICKALEIIELGQIGEIQSVKADFGFKAKFDPNSRLYNPKLGGGALLDIGIYPVFLAYLILGNPTQIQTSVHKGETGVDEEMGMLFSYENGNQGHLHCTFRHTTNCEAFIYGALGTIHIHSRWHEADSLSVHPYEGEVEKYEFDFIGKGYTYEIEEVQRCLAADMTESQLWSLTDSINLMKILDRVRERADIIYDLKG
ncbi:MAG: Gfo/Idh/MocA family protein [Saprospiraceae bacterium]